MKKTGKIIISIILIALIAFSFLFVGFNGKIAITLNNDAFFLRNKIELTKSKYKSNGSWWGYNQSKITSIEDVTFTFTYDNSNFENGNASVTNPYKCDFIMIKNSVITVFGSGNCDRPCNVLADTERNKIYYFLIEETQQNIGTNDFTGMAKTVMYVYDYNSESGEIILNRKEDIIPESSVGKIRMGSYIDSSGNIILAYGQYDGILKVHIFDVENNIWTIQQTMSNYDNDTLMYAYVIMENLQNFYVLCVQDTSKNGEVYYQYVKLFACNNENWTSTMVVDYRNSSIAETETSIVEHTELCFINNKIHLITRSKKMKEIIHYIYKDGQLIKQDTDFLSNNYEWIRLIELNEKMYYVANKTGIIPTLDVIDAEKKEVVFSYMGISISSYIYLNKNWNNNEIQVLCIPSFKTTYKYLKEQIFFIKLK